MRRAGFVLSETWEMRQSNGQRQGAAFLGKLRILRVKEAHLPEGPLVGMKPREGSGYIIWGWWPL